MICKVSVALLRNIVRKSIVLFILCFIPAVLKAQHTANSSTAYRIEEVTDEAPDANIRGGCDDSLSVALQQDDISTPCWAVLRTTIHWNTLKIAPSLAITGQPAFTLLDNKPSAFKFSVGGLSGPVFVGGDTAAAHGGLAAISGYVQRRRWEWMYEDGGGLGDFQFHGAHFVGLNRGTMRLAGQAAPRWTWQGTVTNTFGNDTLRAAAPLDFRIIGESEGPSIDTATYGSHSGNVISGQEDARLQFQASRRTNWNISFGHTLQRYVDEDVTVQTIRGRVDYLHSLTPFAAFGVYGGGGRQTGLAACSLGGGGLLSAFQPARNISANIAVGVSGASAECGKSVQFIGDAMLSLRTSARTKFYVTANRDLSDGIVEHTALLNSGSVGIWHEFSSRVGVRLTEAALYGTAPKTHTSYTGSFSEGAISLPLWGGFVQETTFRHFQVANTPAGDRFNVLTFTLWWALPRTEGKFIAHR